MERDLTLLKGEIAPFLEEIIDLRRQLHRCPELGWEEETTASLITKKLDEWGISWQRHDTAVVGLVEGDAPGGCVGLRADIDALPLEEETGLSFRSGEPGKMHACGHDGHTAILLGTARWLSLHRDRFAGSVKLLFQPAEEADGGAEPMVRQGVLENPRVDRVFGLHVMPYMPPGQIELKKGALNGSSTTIEIKVKGKGGHGAYPESGTDAIMIAGHVITALQSIVSRTVSPLDSAVVSIGTIQGGQAGNIIADEVRMKGTIRTTDNGQRDRILERIRSLVENTARAHGGEGIVEYRYGYVALINEEKSVDLTVRVGEALLGKENINWKEKPSLGVEDFSFFLLERPGCFYHLGCGPDGGGDFEPLHSSRFVLNEKCLSIGIAMQLGISLTALDELKEEL